MDAQQAVFDTLTWSRAQLPVSELVYLYWEGSDTEVSGDALAVFADFSKVSNNRGMTNTTNLTVAQLRTFLVTENGWTSAEFEQLTGYYFRNINQDGTTTLSHDQWTELASAF